MRIISKFHDYYDSVQNMGIDTTCVYIREPKEIPYEQEKLSWNKTTRKPWLGEKTGRTNSIFYTENRFVIGFCGHIFSGVNVTCNEKLQVNKTFYSKDEMIAFEKTLPEKYRKGFPDTDPSWSYKMDFFDEKWREFTEYFILYKVPIFIVGKKQGSTDLEITLNSNLKQCDFQRIKDPYTAYQEIYQYLSGVLGSDAPKIIEIADKDKILKRGFNKWSFRKLPTKHL